MSRVLPKSLIPKVPGFIEPIVQKTSKNLPHFEVNRKAYLVKSQAAKTAKLEGVKAIPTEGVIEVFEIPGHDLYFITEDEAVKKQKSIIRKNRDNVREASRIFEFDRASLAEKNPEMKWLIEAYGTQTILNHYIKIGNELNHKLFPDMRHYFSDSPDKPSRFIKGSFDRHYSIEDNSNDWSWSRDLDFSQDYWSIPVGYFEDTKVRAEWIKNSDEFRSRVKSLDFITNRRALELIVLNAKNLSEYDEYGGLLHVPPFDWLIEILTYSEITKELEEIREVMDRSLFGTDLAIKRVKGNLHYYVTDKPEELDPFKKF